MRPRLEYGATVWNPLQKHLINTIENLQRRASKQVPGISHLSYKDRVISLSLPSLQYRCYRGDMIELYKLFHHSYDETVSLILLNSLKNHNNSRKSKRNHQFVIYKESCESPVRRSSFKSRVTDQWNNLPEHIVNAPSLNIFKNRLRNTCGKTMTLRTMRRKSSTK